VDRAGGRVEFDESASSAVHNPASCETSLTVDNGLSNPLFRVDYINWGVVREIEFTSMEY
jgi:hypothetical protein